MSIYNNNVQFGVETSVIFLNNALLIQQNADIYGNFINENIPYDYIFNINLASVLESNDITSLFNSATYQQNSQNQDDINIILTIDDSATSSVFTSFNNGNYISTLPGLSSRAFGTFFTTPQSFGYSLLEVVAHKLFGHAQAHAAIKNDNEFYNHDSKIWNHFSQSVATESLRNDVFNQYVAIGRYETWTNTSNAYNSENNNFSDVSNYNDVNGAVKFNFQGLFFDFPLYLNGDMYDAGNLNSSVTPDELSVLANGPNVGGSVLANGVYNVPILVRFHA
jgi:hypothetical protein